MDQHVRRLQRRAPSADVALLDLIDTLYEAALAPEEWPAALAHLGQLSGGAWTVMSALPVGAGSGFTLQNAGGDAAHLALFSERYTSPRTNPSIPRMMAMPRGTILRREEHFGDAEWERIDMYNDIYRPAGLYGSLGVLLLRTERYVVPFGMCRPTRSGPFQARKLALLQRVIPHLQRAMQVCLRLNDLETRAAAGEDLWDRLPFGIVLLDQAGRILWTNLVADAVIAAGDGLSARGGFLLAADATGNARLQRLIGEAARTGLGHGLHAGGALSLARPSLKRPLALLVSPFRAERIVLGASPAAAVLISDPERKPLAPAEQLAELYGFTAREAALVSLLLEGLDLAETAERLAVSMNTVRTHLRQVFAKTNTHRQAELVSVLLRSVVALYGGDRERLPQPEQLSATQRSSSS